MSLDSLKCPPLMMIGIAAFLLYLSVLGLQCAFRDVWAETVR